MEKASCKSPPNTNVSASSEHLGLDLKSKGKENANGGCSRPSSKANASFQLDRKRRTHSPASVLPQRRMSEDPPFAEKPLSLTPKTVLSLAQRRYTAEFATPECFGVVAFESPISQIKAKCGSSGDILESCLDNSSGIVVAVRVRPFTSRELDEADVHCVVSMDGNETMVTVAKGEVYRFMYDYSFWSFDLTSANYSNQVQVYEALAKPLLGKVFEGYNTCLFAYGQTGSGKSYSVMGRGTDVGIIPRFCEDLFKRVDETDDSNIKFDVELSFFEIYNEKIHDLLSSSATKDKSSKKICLKVREHPVLGPYVEGLLSYVVKSFEDVSTWITIGNRRRATAATGVNDNSSRSHSVFALLITQTRTDDIEGESLKHNVTSRINLVDLAGSERQSQAKTSGERLREGASINRSLMTLGKVISNLSENSLQTNKKKRLYIPYRESVLTWLLKESLGGNSKTAMLATISPSSSQTEETLSSLRYAKQARYIINTARINEDANAKLIRDLRTEIEKLKCQTGLINDDGFKTSLDEVKRLREQLLKKEKEMAELTRSWQERLLQSEQRKIEEAELLEKSAMALKVDYKLPNLVNLNEDPQLSEVLIYVLHEGKTRVGRARDGCCQRDILLSGPLIEDDHCLFENNGSLVSVEPIARAVMFVNGVAITGTTVLHHGDRVVFGGNHYFRFNNPLELSKDLPQGASSSGIGGLPLTSCHLKDFEFAREELIMKQNLRLEAELEQVRIKHEEEVKRLEQQNTRVQLTMEEQLAETKENARTAIEQYEYRLDKLNRLVNELRQEKLESVQSRLEAKDTIRMLEAVQEDLKNRLSTRNMGLQLEEPKEEVPLCDYESLLIERLRELVEKEKQSLAKTEQRRNAIRSTDNPLRLLLMLQEANRISDFLKRDTRFMQELKYDECKDQILIKVLQTRLNVSTFWTLEKFEQKLLDMKELYQNPDCGDADGIFFDPSDSWESESCIAASSCLLETLKKGLRRQSSIGVRVLDPDASAGSLDLSLSSIEDSPVSTNGHSIGNSCSSSLSVQCFMENCQQNLKASVDWFRSASRETLADKYLWSCNSILKSMTHLTNSFPFHPDFLQTSSNYVICLRLTSAFDSMSKLASVWLSSLNNIESDAVSELCNNVTITVASVGMQIQLFLQGLTNQVSALVNESASVVVNQVYRLCQLCGQLSLATQMPIVSLVDRNDDTYLFKLSLRVKVHFVNGCGEVVDRVLCAAIEKLEDHEIEMIDLSDEYRPKKSSICKNVDSLLGQMVVAVSSVAVLLRKLQSVQLSLPAMIAQPMESMQLFLSLGCREDEKERLQQIELDTTMLEERIKSEAEMPYDNHYYFGYRHCVQVISNIDGIVGGVSGMIAAMRRLLAGKDNETNAKEISLISELISIASSAITAPSTDINVLSSLFFADLCQHGSILSDSQVDLLELAAEEVKGATKNIHDLSKKMLSNGRLC